MMALSSFQVSRNFGRISVTVSILAFTSSLLIFILGLYLRLGFHSGVECDMTWSNPGFIVLDESPTYSYRFLRFVDRRDGRLAGVYDSEKPISGDRNTFELLAEFREKSWCNLGRESHGYPVVFIGGNGSNYNQARSLGAFGINMTRKASSNDVRRMQMDIRQKLIQGTMTRNATSIEDFVYDVYTVDFEEERGALHASMLFAQADYVAHILNQLSEACASEVVVVAHSIGGLVARMAVLKANQMSQKVRSQISVRNVITLATPHATVDLAFEPSVSYFHRHLIELEKTNDAEQHNIFSLSGGFRDNLISPKSCELSTFPASHSISLITADILPQREEEDYIGMNFGIDHRAIVWCHGLLSIIRQMIYTIATSDKTSMSARDISSKTKIYQSQHDCESLSCFYDATQSRLESVYGYLGAFAIRISMIYNIKSFVYLYTIVGMIHFLLVLLRIDDQLFLYPVVPIISASILPNEYRVTSLDSMWSLLTVAYLATSFYFFILFYAVPCLHSIVSSFKSVRIFKTESESYISSYNICNYRTYVMLRHQAKLVSIYLLSAICQICNSRFTGFHMARNSPCFQAHLCLLSVFMIWCNLLKSITNPIRTRTIWFKLQNILIAVLVLVFPIITIGNIKFATSLLTIKGQSKAMIFLTFENDLCLTKSSLMTKVGCFVGNHSLGTFNILYALILLIMLLIHHRIQIVSQVSTVVEKDK